MLYAFEKLRTWPPRATIRRIVKFVVVILALLSAIAVSKMGPGYTSRMERTGISALLYLPRIPVDGALITYTIFHSGISNIYDFLNPENSNNKMLNRSGLIIDGPISSSYPVRTTCRVYTNDYQEAIFVCGGSINNPPATFEMDNERSIYFFHNGQFCLIPPSREVRNHKWPNALCLNIERRPANVRDQISDEFYQIADL